MTRLDKLDSDFRDAKNHIYGLAHNVCINGKEQAALLRAIGESETEMFREGLTGEKIILGLMNIIHDGLAFGNWPWIKNGVDTLK